MRVLVTDAEFKLTLGVIRSLGRRGVDVVAGAATRRALGFASRFCGERVVYPAPRDTERFVSAVARIVEERAIDVVMPVGYDATRACAQHRDLIAAAVPVAGAAAVEVAASKRLTLALAERVGVAVPRTYAHDADISAFPVVVKGALGAGDVRYVNDARELSAVARRDSIVQEYVAGEGRGYFGLFDRGKEKAFFMHRRLREYPITGGASTAAESIDDPELRELGSRLLRELGWHGVAMAEFKYDPARGYTLMELNPKFWGSLDLAIAAGVDFPCLAMAVAVGEAPSEPPEYRVGLRFQWVFSDLLHGLAQPSSLRAVADDLLDAEVATDVWATDLRPNAVEAVFVAAAAIRRARGGALRHPHGRPAVEER
ncbi:MAG: ATP-grasp domain-containing protein [Actinomycetota bacterium]